MSDFLAPYYLGVALGFIVGYGLLSRLVLMSNKYPQGKSYPKVRATQKLV
jgi:uncharacterized membrane protein required for colicin V production